MYSVRSTSKVKDDNFAKNYYRLFRIKLPHLDAVNDLLSKINESEFEELRCRFISVLLEKRVFHRFSFFGKYFFLAVDATGAFNWNQRPPADIDENALKRESKHGKVSRFNLVAEAVLVCCNGMTIPILTEWVANEGKDFDKQDCELKAFKRLAPRLKKFFPRLPVCLLVDGLYTNVALMDVCQQNQWAYITVFKDGNLPSVWQEVYALSKLKNDALTNVSGDSNFWYTYNYRWIKEIEYQKHKVNWMECVVVEQHRDTKKEVSHRFVFLTNLEINRDNIAAILRAGRARWQIEDHFNTQKNRGYVLQHKFSRISFNALKCWHHIRMLACLIIKLVEHTSEFRQLMELPKMTLKELWANLKELLTQNDVVSLISEFEVWSASKRQVRLE